MNVFIEFIIKRNKFSTEFFMFLYATMDAFLLSGIFTVFYTQVTQFPVAWKSC